MSWTQEDVLCPRNCVDLDMTEEGQCQIENGKRMPHICNKYSMIVKHGTMHPRLFKCPQCLATINKEGTK